MTTRGHSMASDLDPLFNPRSVAVVGATNDWRKWGFSTFTSLLDGFEGRVYPVNNREPTVFGYQAFPRVSDIPGPEPVDFVIVVVPAESVPGVMRDCAARGVKAGVIISAGFAETGTQGKRLQDEVLGIAREAGIRFIGPNCMGFWSASANLRAFMFPLSVKPGPFALVSQGGNVGGTLVSSAFVRGMGFRAYVSCGCTADVQIEDYIEYFGRDPEVKVIMAYIEGLNDGARFIEKAGRVSLEKPIIALKPGRTQAAARAITSHSGSLSGSSRLYDSAFRKAGVLRVDTPEDMLDVATGFVSQPCPRGRNVAIITPGGSYGVLSADACATRNLNVVPLSDETIAEFDRIFPPRWSRGNPVDPAGDRNFIAYMKAPELLLKLPEVHALIFMGFNSFTGIATRIGSVDSRAGAAFQATLKGFFDLIPDRETLSRPETDTGWMEKLIARIVQIFFSLFGTSSGDDVTVFSDKLVALLRSERTGPDLKAAFLEMASGYRGGQAAEPGNPFGPVFRQLMESLLQSWIETYGKPVLTTSFMGSTAEQLGFHTFTSADQAAEVISKMNEYREHLEKQAGKSVAEV
jgi:acetyltransferase